jgi:hypothetical protein
VDTDYKDSGCKGVPTYFLFTLFCLHSLFSATTTTTLQHKHTRTLVFKDGGSTITTLECVAVFHHHYHHERSVRSFSRVVPTRRATTPTSPANFDANSVEYSQQRHQHHLPPPSKTSMSARFRRWWLSSSTTTFPHC